MATAFSRRTFLGRALTALGAMTVLGAPGRLFARSRSAKAAPPAEATCLIRYAMTPPDADQLARHARELRRQAREGGGRFIGLFAPYDGPDDMAVALIAFPSLGAREAETARTRTAPGAPDQQRFIQSEDWRFVRKLEPTAARG